MILVLIVALLLYILIPTPRPARYVLAGLLVGGLYLQFWPSTYKSYRLEKEGQHTTGTLVSKTCGLRNRQMIAYRFQAGGQEFVGVDRSSAANRTCGHSQAGDQIFVTYLASDPTINTPEREVGSDIFLGILFSIGIFAWLVWCNAVQERFLAEKRRKKANNR